MRRFRDGEIDVLVATTVIEVGIDVPNATVMIIEHPERFGLSQLHQLRGRVGRGAEAVVLHPARRREPGREAAARRVRRHARTASRSRAPTSQLRGMGDLFGERQSGVPTFRVADPLRDELLNEQAREAAERLLAADPELDAPGERAAAARAGRALRALAGAVPGGLTGAAQGLGCASRRLIRSSSAFAFASSSFSRWISSSAAR